MSWIKRATERWTAARTAWHHPHLIENGRVWRAISFEVRIGGRICVIYDDPQYGLSTYFVDRKQQRKVLDALDLNQ